MVPSQKASSNESQVIDLKSDTRGVITALILAGLAIAAFLVFVGYYGVLWTPGKPLEMMQ